MYVVLLADVKSLLIIWQHHLPARQLSCLYSAADRLCRPDKTGRLLSDISSMCVPASLLTVQAEQNTNIRSIKVPNVLFFLFSFELSHCDWNFVNFLNACGISSARGFWHFCFYFHSSDTNGNNAIKNVNDSPVLRHKPRWLACKICVQEMRTDSIRSVL